VAYVNPREPGESILVRAYSAKPYVGTLVALAAALVGAGLVATRSLGGARSTMAAVTLDDSGWRLLMPRTNLTRQKRDAYFWAVGLAAVLAPLTLHWIVLAGQRDAVPLIVCGMLAAVWVGAMVHAFRRWSIAGTLSDARLRVRPAPLQRGEAFAMELEADAYVPLRVQSVLARVICTEHYREKRGNKTSYGTRTHTERETMLSDQTQIPAGQVLEGRGELTVDRAAPPTTDLTVKEYPYYTWDLRIHIVLEGAADYVAVFPLEVT
jgi:hypothetical protein